MNSCPTIPSSSSIISSIHASIHTLPLSFRPFFPFVGGAGSSSSILFVFRLALPSPLPDPSHPDTDRLAHVAPFFIAFFCAPRRRHTSHTSHTNHHRPALGTYNVRYPSTRHPSTASRMRFCPLVLLRPADSRPSSNSLLQPLSSVIAFVGNFYLAASSSLYPSTLLRPSLRRCDSLRPPRLLSRLELAPLTYLRHIDNPHLLGCHPHRLDIWPLSFAHSFSSRPRRLPLYLSNDPPTILNFSK